MLPLERGVYLMAQWWAINFFNDLAKPLEVSLEVDAKNNSTEPCQSISFGTALFFLSPLKSNRTFPSIVTIAMQIILQSQLIRFVELSVSLFLEAVSSYIEKAGKRSGQQ